MRSRTLLVTLSIGAVAIIAFSMSSGWLTTRLRRQHTPIGLQKWEDLTTNEQLERTRKQNNQGYHYAAPDENYDINKLSKHDRDLLNRLAKGSNDRDKRTQTIERLYQVDSEDAWNRHLDALDDEGLPPLTKFTQKYIYDHQHPESCADKEFLILNSFPNDENFGLGAIVFSVSMNLNIALRYNKILLHNPKDGPGRHFVDKTSREFCTNSMDCFFESLSSCTMDDVTPENSMELPAKKLLPQDLIGTPSGSIPPIFGIALRRLHPLITPDSLKYWWRSQAIAYIMRFNGRTMKELLDRRRSKTMQKSLSFDGDEIIKGAGVPFPMPAGSVNMHVRHGDKGIEMTLKPFSQYLDAAEKFISMNPLHYRKIAFLSTENPDVFKDAADHLQKQRELYRVLQPETRTTSDWAWTWYWSDIPRSNIGPEEQLEKFGNRTDMTINWFLQLMMAIECDFMIGSRASGWSRMLDGLRCIWLANCQLPFLDVGDELDWRFYGA